MRSTIKCVMICGQMTVNHDPDIVLLEYARLYREAERRVRADQLGLDYPIERRSAQDVWSKCVQHVDQLSVVGVDHMEYR